VLIDVAGNGARGDLDKTTFTFDFELNLPAKDAAARMSCGK
jgi:hypothetical protein